MDAFSENLIQAYVQRGGSDLDMDGDSCIGKMRVGWCDLHVKVAETTRVVAFISDGKRNVAVKHDVAKDLSEQGSHYKLRVQIKDGLTGICHTEYPSNAIRLIEAREGGSLTLYEASIVSQNGEFYCPVQEQYDVRCYADGDTVRCPYFETPKHHWPQLMSVLTAIVDSLGVSLPKWVAQKAETDYSFSGIKSGMAGVEWYNAASGVGGLITDQGPARVHWSQITRQGERFAYLTAGEIVTYSALRAPHITKDRKTRYVLEAFDVRLSQNEWGLGS